MKRTVARGDAFREMIKWWEIICKTLGEDHLGAGCLNLSKTFRSNALNVSSDSHIWL